MSQLWAWVESLSESKPGALTLSPEESRHVHSRRLRIGDELVVFDGSGRLATARIEGLVKKSVQVEIDAITVVPAPKTGFRLATAIPKGERLSTMLQMWTQLGLEVWQPLVCEDSAVRKIDVAAPRLRRILIEGCKVARRPWAMSVLPSVGLEEAIGRCDPDRPIQYGDRGRDDLTEGGRAGSLTRIDASSGTVFIGPEAGFSRTERRSFEGARATPVSFGEYNLRIETAAVAAITAFNLARQSEPENLRSQETR